MITITVASYNGGPLPQPLAAHFDELGGNIGRADNNQLVLPDPERTISRVHAQIVFRGGSYAIVDRGSNPVSVNGRPLGNGQEAPLQPGDELQIGGYAMRVEAQAPQGQSGGADPFADFGGLAAPAPAAGRPAPAAAAGFADPLAAFGMAALPPTPAGAQAFGAPAAAGGIPDDWDPFAAEPAAAKPRSDDFARSLGQAPAALGGFGLEVGGRSSAPLIPDLHGGGAGAGSTDSLDNLFGLGPASSSAGADPFANSPLQQAAALPNMAGNADPMKALNRLTRASATAAADNLSELQTPFNLPPMSVPAAVPKPAPPPPPPRSPAVDTAAPKGAVLSWDDAAGENRTIIRPKAQPAAAPAATSVPADLSFDLAPPVAPVPRPAAVPPPPIAVPAASNAASTAPPSADMAALLAALRDGLGVERLPVDRLTPELMRLVGQLVHEATRGTVDLLVARAALKREIRAEVTMIVARENNPLKFSPSVDVALNHLLAPPARGFMAPDRAMRDAYDDLRAHQFGFLAGMRAALEGVLKRFDPAMLEAKLTQKSILSSILPASRKARMWDVFQELYGQISAEASDDFHELFGKEFLRAYEEHIEQLAKDRP